MESLAVVQWMAGALGGNLKSETVGYVRYEYEYGYGILRTLVCTGHLTNFNWEEKYDMKAHPPPAAAYTNQVTTSNRGPFQISRRSFPARPHRTATRDRQWSVMVKGKGRLVHAASTSSQITTLLRPLPIPDTRLPSRTGDSKEIMASASNPAVAPHRNHFWNPSQPIRFAPTTRPLAGDTRWRAVTLLAFEDKIGTTQLNARAFSATASQPALRGGRASRPSLISKGEHPNDILVVRSVDKWREEARKEEKKDKSKARKEVRKKIQGMDNAMNEDGKKKEEAEQKREQAKAERDQLLRSRKSLAAELDTIESRVHALKIMDISAADFMNISAAAFMKLARLKNLQTLFDKESKLPEIESDIGRIFEACAQVQRRESKKLDAEMGELDLPPEGLQFLQQPIQSVWRAIREESLERLAEKMEQDAGEIRQIAEKLAAVIVVSWYSKRIDMVERGGEEMMPTFFRRNDVRKMLDQIVLSPKDADRLHMSWRLICAMITLQRKKETKRYEQKPATAWERNNRLWRRIRLRRAADNEHCVEEDDYESTPGYEGYAKPMKQPIHVLFQFLFSFRDHYQGMTRHLDEQREKWRTKSTALLSSRDGLLEASIPFKKKIAEEPGNASRLIKLQHLVDSLESTLMDVMDDLALFAAAFNYEYLRLEWHWNKFRSTVSQVHKMGHDARQLGLQRLQFASSEPHLRLLARMRAGASVGNTLIHSLRLPAIDWEDMQQLMSPSYHWFPPSTSRQLVDVKKYVTYQDFERAERDAVHTKFGPILEELNNLAIYAAASGKDAGGRKALIDQNSYERLLLWEFSKESLTHQKFFKHLQPLLKYHARGITHLNQCLDELDETWIECVYDRIKFFENLSPRNELVLNSVRPQLFKAKDLKRSMVGMRTEWMNSVFGDINELGRMAYEHLNQPSYADRLAEDAPRLRSWFLRRLAGESKNIKPSRSVSALAIARQYPQMMAELNDFKREMQSLARREKKRVLREKRATLQTATRHNISARHKKERAILASELQDSLTKDLELSIDSSNHELTSVGDSKLSPTYLSFQPSGPKHASHPSFFSKDPPSSESLGYQSDLSSNTIFHEGGQSEAEPVSGEDPSDSQSGSEMQSGSGPESDSNDESVFSSDADPGISGQEETYTPLDFQIPADAMREAMLASPGTPASFWSHKLYRGPGDEKVTVHYCRSKETGETVAKLFLDKPVLGFDIEWKPRANAAAGLKSNVSLIQLACEDRVGLFHIALHKGETPEEVLPPTLRAIMASPDVVKTGVAILSDFSRVAKYLDTQARGVVELSHWHRLITYAEHDPKMVNKRLVSLAIQVETHLQLPLSKGDVRTSDWSKQLNHEQCSYAAADAYASYRLYEALEEKRMAMKPRPPRPQFAELKMPIKLTNRVVVESSSDEDLADVVDKSGEVEDLNLSSGGRSLAMDENITDEELLAIESAAQEDVTSDIVRYPELPPFDDYTESPSAQLVGRVRLANAWATTPTKVTAIRKLRKQKSTSILPSTEHSSLLAAATTWADSQTKPTSSSAQPHHREGRKGGTTLLKCYYLWHHEGLNVDEVAKIVRNPALKKGTVATSIADAVGYGGCEMGNLRRLREVLDLVPMQAWGRFRKLRREVEEGLAGGAEKGKGEGNRDDWVV